MMDNLEKLIDQYKKKTGKKPIHNRDGVYHIEHYSDNFVKWLASCRTCGEEQRKFLDEIEGREIIEWQDNVNMVFGNIDEGRISRLDQKDFNADLKKVVKGE